MDFSDVKNYEANIKLCDFPIECSSESKKLLLKTLIERIKPVVTEKYEI